MGLSSMIIIDFFQITGGIRFYGYMWWLKSGSYAILKTFENVNVNSIYVSFKTNQLSGMLLYKPGTVSGKLFVFFFIPGLNGDC